MDPDLVIRLHAARGHQAHVDGSGARPAHPETDGEVSGATTAARSDVRAAALLPVNREAQDVPEALEDFIDHLGVSVRSELCGHDRLLHS